MRNADRGDINLFNGNNFTEFCSVLDGKLKQLNITRKYVEKNKAEVITVEMEEKLWESGMLGELCTQEWRRTLLSSTLPLFNSLEES